MKLTIQLLETINLLSLNLYFFSLTMSIKKKLVDIKCNMEGIGVQLGVLDN